MSEMATKRVHPTAIVHPEARVADDVTIGPYSIIGPHVTIGAGCDIRSHVLIEGHTTLGSGNRVFHSAAIGCEPQDFSYRGEESYVVIGDGNTIREYVTIQPGSEAGSTTRVGDGNLLMAYVHVAHNCEVGSRTVIANTVQLAGHVHVDDFAVIGGITPVHQFVRIGRHCIIGGGSRIPQDVAPYAKVAGNPPRTFGLNTIGLSRRGFSDASISSLKRAYRLFFRSKLTAEEACARIVADVPDTAEVRHFLEFVRAEGRGITR
jgi:UDP-N-acetylglucosamine acyltransferase